MEFSILGEGTLGSRNKEWLIYLILPQKIIDEYSMMSCLDVHPVENEPLLETYGLQSYKQHNLKDP